MNTAAATIVDLDRYLFRLGINRSSLEVGENALRLLQHRHLLSIPFENLDIHRKKPIALDTGRFYNKIVVNERGGFCYELNGLFNELLTDLGFKTRIVSARVFDGHGNFSPEYDHLAIVVTLNGHDWLADVGFGEFAAQPLKVEIGTEQIDETGVFVIRGREDDYLEVAKKTVDGWRPEYIFKPAERDLNEFIPLCDFQQFSPDSHFFKGKICSIMTEDGRKTLSSDKFIVTRNGDREETLVASNDDFDAILLREFKIRRDF